MFSMRHLWSALWLCCGLAVTAGELQDAAGRGDIEKVRSLMRSNPFGVSARDGGTTALHEAARAGHIEIVKLLVGGGANVNATDFSGLTPLKLATGRHPEIANYLRAQGGLEKVTAPARVATTPTPATTPKSSLFSSNQSTSTAAPKTASVQTNAAPAPAKKPNESDLIAVGYPIHEAARAGDVEQIKYLFKTSPDLMNATDEKGLTPLHVAAGKKQTNAAQVLLGLGAKVNARADSGVTPLHTAVRRGDVDMTRLLLANRASASVRDNFDTSPLMLAVLVTDQPELVRLLLAHRAEVNVRNRVGGTPLGEAARVGNDKAVEMLLAAGAEPSAIDGAAGVTPLHVAAGGGHAGIVRSLLSHRAKVDALDARGETPLAYALREGRTETIALLRKAGGTTGVKPTLDPSQKSLVDFYERMEATLRTGSNADKSRTLLSLNPTKADIERMFRKHSAAAWLVVDEVNKQIKRASTQSLRDADAERELWRVRPGPPSGLVQEWRTRGWMAQDLPVFSLTVDKTGSTSRPGDFCFVNGHWVLVPPLNSVAAVVASSGRPKQ
jgi:ankyrin repeat protein